VYDYIVTPDGTILDGRMHTANRRSRMRNKFESTRNDDMEIDLLVTDPRDGAMLKLRAASPTALRKMGMDKDWYEGAVVVISTFGMPGFEVADLDRFIDELKAIREYMHEWNNE
jgi:hypothetical protein